MKLDYRLLNPVGFHVLQALRDTNLRLIINYGGSSSGKSFSTAQAFILVTLLGLGNVLVLRKVGASIQKSIYEDFKQAARSLKAYQFFRYTDSTKRIVCLLNKCRIDFAGLDDPEKIKGIAGYRWVFMEEFSEFDEADFKQIRKRLRGRKGQQIVAAFNPIKVTHWIKRAVFDSERWNDVPMEVSINGKKIPEPLTKVKTLRINSAKTYLNPRTKEVEEHAPDTLLIQSTYLNNFWVVGSPDGSYGFYDEQCVADFEKDRTRDPDYYNVYALGEWGVIRTGCEFFTFNRGKHTADVAYDPSLPIHVSVDSNVLPYISFTLWQYHTDGEKKHLVQIGEVCAESPNNTVRKSARLLVRTMKKLGCDHIILHGDASTRNANNIDDNKRSFHDLLIDYIQRDGIEVTDKVGKRNPSVAMTGEFINAIYDGALPHLSITIGSECLNSIADYTSVQKDENGAILKTKVKNKTTGQTYEEFGHLSDTMRYLVTDLLSAEFTKFANRRKRNLYAKYGAISYFNPEREYIYSQHLVYTMPNIGGKFVMLHGGRIGDRWHILDVAFTDTASTEDIKQRLLATSSAVIVVECSEAYYSFVREIRAETSADIRVRKEATDLDGRIAATSDMVRQRVFFNADSDDSDEEYAAFVTSLLDYNPDSPNKEASAALSGFVHFFAKSF